MGSYEGDSPSSDELVKEARRQVSSGREASTSSDMVSEARNRAGATWGEEKPAPPAPVTGAIVGSTPISGDRATFQQARTRVGHGSRRRSQVTRTSPFEVAPRRIGRVRALVALALIGFAVASLVSPISDWLESLSDTASDTQRVETSPVATTPGALVVSGDTTLDQDHDGQVIVASDNVILDCAGHAIRGSGQRVGIAVFDVNDVTVRDCAVEGFEAAIVVINSRRSVIEGNATSRSPTGVVIMESSEITVVGNAVDATSRGVQVVNTHSSDVEDNETSASAVGFDVIEATGNTFHGNRAVGSEFSAFSITNADGNVFEENEVESSHFGFVVTSSDDNTFDANTVTRGFGWFSFGFQERSEGNTITNNEVTGGGLAFKVYIGSTGNTISDNVARYAAKGVSIDAGCTGNVVERNTITSSREIGLEDTSRGGQGDLRTDNHYRDNQCSDNATASQPSGLCDL